MSGLKFTADNAIREVIALDQILSDNIISVCVHLGFGVVCHMYFRLNHLFIPSENFEDAKEYIESLKCKNLSMWVKYYHKPERHTMYLVDFYYQDETEVVFVNDELVKLEIAKSRSKR